MDIIANTTEYGIFHLPNSSITVMSAVEKKYIYMKMKTMLTEKLPYLISGTVIELSAMLVEIITYGIK